MENFTDLKENLIKAINSEKKQEKLNKEILKQLKAVEVTQAQFLKEKIKLDKLVKEKQEIISEIEPSNE